MRCKNCGWENPDNLTRCEKCNTPLEGASFNAAPTAAPQQNFNKTVNEAAVFPETPVGAGNVCPQCGYPMRPGVNASFICHPTRRDTERFPQTDAQRVSAFRRYKHRHEGNNNAHN